MSEPRFVRAGSVGEAAEAMREASGDGLIVAGGIVVGSMINQGLAAPSVLVDISRIDDMRRIARDSEGLTLGALVTHDAVLRSADVAAAAPLLKSIALEIACPRLRNRGTIGGSICTIGGQGDPATGFIALGATLRITGPDGTRRLAIEDLYKGALSVDLEHDELVESIFVPALGEGARHGFCKLGPRNAMDFTQITAAVVIAPAKGVPGALRIGMNGVAATPSRPRATERLIAGVLTDAPDAFGAIDWAAVADTLNGEIEPEDDLVYSQGFKRHLGLVALRRAIAQALARRGAADGGS